MRKIKALFITAVFMLSAAGAFAADATVTFVSGKVEVQRGGKWVALQKGDTVAKSETISTGFDSEAKIKILDSVMYLGPVTRITLEELSSKGQKDNVSVYLKTGTTRSQVRHTDNKRVNYQVHTAVAVASCRGTEWIIDDGNNIACLEGTVAVAAYQEPSEDDETEATSSDSSDKDEDEDSDEKSEDKEEKEDKEDKTEDKSEEKESDSTEEASGEKSEEKTKSSDKEKNTPTSDDGVLVKANQSVTVSETSSVSAPVVAVVKTADAVTTTVSTAGSKEGVGGVGGVTGAAPEAAGTTMPGTGNAAVKPTATVNVTIIVPADL